MPRPNPRRPIFPSEDGAFASTARADIPQLVSPRPPNNITGSATTTAPWQHQNHHRRVAIGPSGRGLAVQGGLLADNQHFQHAEEPLGSLEDEDFDEDDDNDLEEDEEDEGIEDDEDYDMQDDSKDVSSPIPPNLREISSLASWTVSTHKPGCGVTALRHPSPSQFWQSDGPQPHTLTLHFFKRVAVVRIRVYLDFELDESYTPTKMVFLAGMGGNDLVEFATWQGEAPCGWVDISLDGVGGRHERRPRRRKREVKGKNSVLKSSRKKDHREYDHHVDAGGNSDSEDDGDSDAYDDLFDNDDPSAGNVLKAMVIQVRICENHQNGKDTHVRGFQVFARDDRYYTRTRRDSTRKSLRSSGGARKDAGDLHPTESDQRGNDLENGMATIDESEWFLQPEIR
ncbi:Anaphase-promoting complex, subunit 10 family protein [Coccidioides posadasii C735 delta SOWgp]|uniref:Anaphase-promoting complex, subunit 10 family protein n=1 Tax=Coccidioides posadasii (strain C735) TaxID=222929 RepID=C5P892_COCP7|nr:Anaphase-promoting complex, subunit 10 family protein [Coccidioides posadasii C735 delta SOWgp]EER26863.1 Anaphase-promoting complex, subunit 10 family protein [Coccidioides posadasii C735 delta SOWgp]|eukprot:XP_003069008.1 Anaphase-promoting complex, subunit 10 family protein [Coccidioides posadasii C735 delta SOWgp]